jgi:lipopolysaccharide/colanic/teichoic acid biosynthesis glycosyltransferase
MIKRLFDIAFSLTGLVMFSPIIAAVALLIKLEDRGPAFYRGVRVGKNGRPFKIFKFRSMVTNADKIGGPSTSDDDPRLLKIGKFIRNYKLDEIPQLINVLTGEMSLVGPRPEVPSEAETYTDEEKRVFLVKPGITDWASLTYHNEGEILKGSADPHQAYREKIKPGKLKLQLQYVDHHDFLTDIRIIFKTLSTLIATRT